MSSATYSITREREEVRGGAQRNYLLLLRHVDWMLVVLVFGLALVGVWALEGAVNGIEALRPVAGKQMAFFWIAAGAMVFAFVVEYRWINRMAATLYVLNLGALVFVLLSGSRVNGARSWIDLGPVNWQPSETMKIATVLVCSQWLALHPERVRGWLGILVPGCICGVPALLVLMQPDLGTASLFFVLFLAVMMMAGASMRKLLLIVLASLIGMASAYPFLKPYQKDRIVTFLRPESDPRGAGYNVIQSKIAVGSGGMFGQGWGGGTQSTHRFLPEHHTDFIFGSFVEQFGFLGGLALLTCYGLLAWRMIRAMDNARDRFGGIVVAGLLAIFLGHLVLNIGMTMGLMPVTGIPLPFMSYGGSFLISVFVLFGIVLNVASRRYTLAGP